MLHNLEQAAIGIGLYMISDKIEYMYFKDDGAITTLNVKPLKLVGYMTFLGSNISLMENDVNIRIGKIWTVIEELMIM